MLRPKSLQKGDTIGILSTARSISLEELSPAIDLFKSWGLKIIIGKTIGKKHHQFSGKDSLRAYDLQEMLDNPKIKAIICARGGYGTIRIIDKLDFTKFNINPKWIVGYSDITVLHTHINNFLGIQTLHASMPINYKNNTKESLDSLKKVLFGDFIHYKLKSNRHNVDGTVKGKIIGGNLSILYSILGTDMGFNPDNKILFIEEIDEMLYHIDRMMIALKKAGKLNKIKAIIVGGMTDLKDNTKSFGFSRDNPFGANIYEIIKEHTSFREIPICFDFPAGHLYNNLAIPMGKTILLKINSQECSLSDKH